MAGAREIDAAAAAWFAKRDKGTWDEQERQAFEAWLAESVAHRVAFLRVEAAWARAERLRALAAGVEPGTVPLPGHWRFDGVPAPPAPSSPETQAPQESRRFAKVMAAAAACVAVALVIIWKWSVNLAQFTEYSTAIGDMQVVPLTDGSTITLNTDSQVRVALTDAARKVQLPRGEAFFEVVKDAKRPFVVEAGNKQVVVVGTKFSVWNDGRTIRVAVIDGQVRLEGSGPPAHLKAGDIARADRDNTLVQHLSLAALEDELSWRRGYLVFHETPLDKALDEFNRYNTKKARVADPELASIKIDGSFRVSNLDAFLRLLEQGFPIRVVKRGDEVVLEREHG